MTSDRVLVTGGAGFIGSFLVEALQRDGCHVRVLDSFEPQVHGAESQNVRHLGNAEVIRGDVRDAAVVEAALRDVDAVVHLAAQVAIGQSMYQIARFVDHNALGTAVLLDAVVARKPAVKKLVVASSMSVYGEGAATCAECGDIQPRRRDVAHPGVSRWELCCPKCGGAAEPRPTPETTPAAPTSVYGITKRDQEEMCLTVGRAHGVPVAALRFFNVYGPRQALGNPYTGVAAIFCSRLRSGKSPVVFEDGGQTRDFVHVSDVVQAVRLALANDAANFEVFNVGTGHATSVLELAQMLGAKMGAGIAPRIEGTYREGDIRHCHADITKIRDCLGYSPRIALDSGVEDLIAWASEQAVPDHFDRAAAELAGQGLGGLWKR